MNGQNKASFPFIEIPENYINLKKDIKDETLKSLYSKFNFIYFIFKEDTKNETSLYDYLKKINFIVFKKSTTISKLIILCFEGHCLFIECIDENFFKKFIEDNISFYIDLDSTNKNIDVKEEIKSFCSYISFEEEIKSNLFLKQTIEPISAYIIRRYFYPSRLFKDKSFFTYKQSLKETEKNNFSEFNTQEMFMKIENDKKEINKKHINEFEDFHMNDFIQLRVIHSNKNSSFNLVIHLKSFYIFLLKMFKNSELFLLEKKFIKNYSNQYLTHFYGFVKEEGEEIGFVYEFMSNGSLDQYESINDIFPYMAMLRIAQGIKYLHSNSLIHRDIKPSNILIDHDHIPYLSDFDTIRKIDETTQVLTCDIGYICYTSPEQFYGNDYSFPTDIYSFGQIIYYLFEKKDNLIEANAFNILDVIRNYRIPDKCRIPRSIRDIFKRCISYEAKNRPTIDEVINYLYEDANSFYYLHNPFIKKIIDSIDEQITIQYLKEIYYLLFIYKELKDDYFKTHKIQLYLILNFIFKETEIFKIIYNIGKIYYDGEIVKQNFLFAKEYFDISAEMNYSDAIFYIGKLYSLGQGVERNYEKAIEYYEKAIKQNHSFAMIELGNLYEEGLGVERNYSKAIEYYESAITLNNPYALCCMAHLYQFGYGVEENIEKAIEYYTISANQNVPDSLVNLGFLYQTGEYFEIDYQKSKQFYESALKFKCPRAYTNLGFQYQFGQGVEQNYQKAIEYFLIAASSKEPNAINNLGTLYFNGQGVERNYEKAREYFESASKLNLIVSIHNLGIIYKKGLGVPKDYLLAKYYFEKSSDFEQSLYQIGKLYYHGYGVEKDFVRAKNLFEITENQLVKSSYRLGMLYMNGCGVEQDYEKAFKYFEKASLENYYKAFYQMGVLHFYGLIQMHNYLEARKCFQISSEKILDSMYYLGLIYEEGLGVKQDISKSIEFYLKCSKNKTMNYVSTPSRNPTVFQSQIKNDALPYETSILNNKFYYHSNNELGFIYHLEKKHDKAFEYFKEPGHNEYAFGQNNLGLYLQIYLNKKENAIYFYEKAIKNSRFALSVFNLGYINEKDGKFDESIEYYKKASEYENEPFVFKEQIYEDERLENSKSFIICYTNLKLYLFYYSQQNRLKNDFILKAIFRPLFLLIFHTKSYSYTFNFRTIQSENGIIITNLKDFILNNPLFSYHDKLSDSQHSTSFGWSTVKPKSEENLELSLLLIQTDQPNNNISNKQNDKNIDCKEKFDFEPDNDFLTPQIDEQSLNFDFNQIIENIFEYMNKQNKFILIKNEFNESNQDINYEIVKIKMKGNNINRYFRYPKSLYEVLMNTFKNNENEIIKIIEEMKEIIYKEPYAALFGRIGLDKSDKTTSIDINRDFYEGIGEDFS